MQTESKPVSATWRVVAVALALGVAMEVIAPSWGSQGFVGLGAGLRVLGAFCAAGLAIQDAYRAWRGGAARRRERRLYQETLRSR